MESVPSFVWTIPTLTWSGVIWLTREQHIWCFLKLTDQYHNLQWEIEFQVLKLIKALETWAFGICPARLTISHPSVATSLLAQVPRRHAMSLEKHRFRIYWQVISYRNEPLPNLWLIHSCKRMGSWGSTGLYISDRGKQASYVSQSGLVSPLLFCSTLIMMQAKTRYKSPFCINTKPFLQTWLCAQLHDFALQQTFVLWLGSTQPPGQIPWPGYWKRCDKDRTQSQGVFYAELLLRKERLFLVLLL